MFRPSLKNATKERLKARREDGTWDDAVNKVLDREHRFEVATKRLLDQIDYGGDSLDDCVEMLRNV